MVKPSWTQNSIGPTPSGFNVLYFVYKQPKITIHAAIKTYSEEKMWQNKQNIKIHTEFEFAYDK